MLKITLEPNRSSPKDFVRKVVYTRSGDVVTATEVYMTSDRTFAKEVHPSGGIDKDWSGVRSGPAKPRSQTAKRDWLVAMGVVTPGEAKPWTENYVPKGCSLVWCPDAPPYEGDQSGAEFGGAFAVEVSNA